MKAAVKKILSAFLAAAVVLTASACSKKTPSGPVTVEIWHYYNGALQQSFADMVTEFNDTIGREKGIVVTAQNKGSLSEIRDLITQSAKKEVGSQPLPTIFSSYADTAFEFYQSDLIADMAPYISDKERSAYIAEYLEEGNFGGKNSLMLWPVAKSTEVFMLNITDWQPFADACSVDISDLATCEGLTETAKKYYEYTDSLTEQPDDGKAFFGRDSLANYMIIGSLQLGTELFCTENASAVINIDKKAMRRLWDNYYVPYVSGYFASIGRYRSDDAKTGDILAYVGSTSSAAYFPDSVILASGDSYPVEAGVFTAPIFEGGKQYAVQQGAGMAVVKSDKRTEQAAVEFLKWFTEPKQNLRFTASTGYLPVRHDSNDPAALKRFTEGGSIKLSPVAEKAVLAGMETSNSCTMYTNGAFKNSYELRSIVENLCKQRQITTLTS